jgi:hypothetical protein
MHQRTKICDPVFAVIDYKKWQNIPYIVAYKMTLKFLIKDLSLGLYSPDKMTKYIVMDLLKPFLGNTSVNTFP